MTEEFAGKVAIVTGSSGIGLGGALRLARGGARVFVAGIDPDHNRKAEEAAAGLSMTVHQVDVADEQQVSAWIASIVSETGGIDVVVNAAAIQTYGDIEDTDIAHWDRVMNVNLRSYYLVCHFAYPHMKNRGGGSIILLASGQGHANQNRVLAYAVTKGAAHTMARAMAVDCARDNVRVNTISPGSIRTPLLEIAAREIVGEGNPIEETIAGFGASHPLGRVGTIEECGELIAFLAGPRSGFCTGADFRIDGGLTAQLGV